MILFSLLEKLFLYKYQKIKIIVNNKGIYPTRSETL